MRLKQGDMVRLCLGFVVSNSMVDEDALQVADLNAPAVRIEVCSQIVLNLHVLLALMLSAVHVQSGLPSSGCTSLLLVATPSKAALYSLTGYASQLLDVLSSVVEGKSHSRAH